MDLDDKIRSLEEKISQKRQEKNSSSTARSSSSRDDVRCKMCNDAGVIYDVQRNVATPCGCMKERKREKLFKNSRITPAFRQKNFDNFITENKPDTVKKMLQAARHYLDNFNALGENNWLVLLGEPGCGKTHLSMAVANALLDQECPVLYFPHLEGMNELKETFNQGEVTLDEKLAEMKEVQLLVWDDLFKGREDPTDWTLEIVFEVLNYRYLNLMPTIVSSEKPPEELYKIDKAIGSRILERGKSHTVVAEGYSCNHRIN